MDKFDNNIEIEPESLNLFNFVTFRKFCGTILTNLFNTKFTFDGMSKNMFTNK